MLLRRAKEFAIELGDNFESDTNLLFRWKERQNVNESKAIVKPWKAI